MWIASPHGWTRTGRHAQRVKCRLEPGPDLGNQRSHAPEIARLIVTVSLREPIGCIIDKIRVPERKRDHGTIAPQVRGVLESILHCGAQRRELLNLEIRGRRRGVLVVIGRIRHGLSPPVQDCSVSAAGGEKEQGGVSMGPPVREKSSDFSKSGHVRHTPSSV